MIKDILSFVVSDTKFASDFQKTPIILKAEDYLNGTNATNGQKTQKFKFQEVEVEIFNLSEYLGIENVKTTSQTKILVGELSNKLFGVLVDQVVEIINLNNNEIDPIQLTESMNIYDKKNYIEVSDDKLRFIDIDDFIKDKVS